MTHIFGKNELIWLIYIVINYLFILFAYRKWGKLGVLIFVPLSIVLANIQVSKLVTLFGVETTLGNIAYGSIFIIEDILSENYGKKYAKTVIGLGFISLIFTTVVMNIALVIMPSVNDTMQQPLSAVFSPLYRLTIASLAAYVCSTYTDATLYQIIRKFWPSYKALWVRNNLSTVFSQIVDNIVFTLVAFLGTHDLSTVISIMISTYFLKLIISFADTPFVYIAALWKKQGKIKEIDGNVEPMYDFFADINSK